MSADLARHMERAGALLAEALAPESQPSRTTGFGTVKRVSGATLTVSYRGADLEGLPMTTACSGAKAGDRCVVQAVGSTAVVIGIIAK